MKINKIPEYELIIRFIKRTSPKEKKHIFHNTYERPHEFGDEGVKFKFTDLERIYEEMSGKGLLSPKSNKSPHRLTFVLR